MFKESDQIEKFEPKVWLSSPTMHGEEFEFLKEAYNSEYKETIYKDENGDTDDLRLVDWKRKVQDSPHIFTSDDYDMIVNSKKLFARKFDEKTDINIVIQLHDRICEEQKVKGHL